MLFVNWIVSLTAELQLHSLSLYQAKNVQFASCAWYSLSALKVGLISVSQNKGYKKYLFLREKTHVAGKLETCSLEIFHFLPFPPRHLSASDFLENHLSGKSN